MRLRPVEIKMKAGLLAAISVSKPAWFMPGYERAGFARLNPLCGYRPMLVKSRSACGVSATFSSIIS
jgi:hypothetical protein